MDVQVSTTSGEPGLVPDAAIAALRGGLRGTVLLPDEPGYDAARSIWNAMIDRRPGLIVQALGAADVVRAVNFARDQRLSLSVRGGGHNVSGNAVCDGGVMLDLSRMRSVRVDRDARRVRVEGGATLGDLDKETQALGFVVPVGINSTTGVAGLTLGGGFGWTSRKFGLAIDSLESVDIVTADGQLRRADAAHEPDLFWAVRGGGGNFGVVTSFEFRLHELGPLVVAGLLAHPLDDAPAVIAQYRQLIRQASEELTCTLFLTRAPPAPFVPTEWHGRHVLVMALCHCGSIEAGTSAVAPFRAIGRPILDLVGPQPFVAWQAALDPLLTPGARNYWKSHDLKDLSDPVISLLVESVRAMPGEEGDVMIVYLGGQVSRVPESATAYSRRGVQFLVSIHMRWRDPGEDEDRIVWTRRLFDRLAPHATGGVYVNFMTGDEPERVRGAYGANYDRLLGIKRRYDPANLFRLNQNIAVS